MLMLPDFNRLYHFYQIYRNSSIARTAEALFVTQSAVSQNLSKLEQELGLRLFNRINKRLVATPAAEQLYQTVMPFFSTLDGELQSIHASDASPHGVVRIGAPPVFGAEYLPSVITAFRSKFPEVTFEIKLGTQQSIVKALHDSELDVAMVDIFGNREEESWNLIQEPLLDEPLILAGSAAYVRHHLKNQQSPELLAACRFIAYQHHAPELSEWFLRHFDVRVDRLDIVLVVDSVHAVINAVRSNLGLGIVPKYLVTSELQKNKLVTIGNGSSVVKSRISLLRHPRKKSGAAEQAFIVFLKNALDARKQES